MTEVLRCAACVVDSQGETSFLQHINGRAHARKARRPGFAGLLPNDMGVIPELRHPQLRAAAAAWGHSSNQGVGAPWTPEVRAVAFPSDVEAQARRTLAGLPPISYPARTHTKGSSRSGGGSREGGERRGGGPIVPGRVRPEGGPFARQRAELPVAAHRGELLQALTHPACIIEGETGSGKTTQVAQYLMEEAARRGEAISIICTQPRRISAIGVAERVAAERGERVGGSVGYSIRGETAASSDTCLLFCTTGILLRRLEEDPGLEGTTHVLVDEVHERTLEGDFLLLTLRRLLRDQAAREVPPARRLHLALMSATMDGAVLADYFAGCPRVSFPGRAFPVTPLYLEDALRLTGHRVERAADWCRHSAVAVKRKARRAALATAAEGSAPDGASPREWAARFPRHPPEVHAALADLDLEAINTALIAQLACWFLRAGSIRRALEAVRGRRVGDDDGDSFGDDAARGTAVLVFLPGTREIQDAQEALLATPEFGRDPVQRAWVLPLHGALPAEEQRRVFERPPPGAIKVVLATNVAETSITIDDVGFVIDAGRVKEERYDAERRIGSLEDVFVSAAAAKQRRGRAGRVCPGLAVHLYPSDIKQAAFQEPEVRRVALQQLVMRTKALRLPGRAGDICEELPEPPAHAAVVGAVHELDCIGALTLEGGEEALTPLGELLAKLPVDAKLGKLIVYGLCFGAGDEALTIAAALNTRSPFLSPIDRREEADKCKKNFAAGSQSDHLAVLYAYNRFDSRGQDYRFAQENFLGVKSLQAIAQLKRQLLETLSHAGLVPHGLRSSYVEMLGRQGGGSDGCLIALGESRKPPPPEELLTALLAAALYPQVAFVNSVAAKNSSGKANKAQTTLNIREADTAAPAPQLASVHPSSVNSQVAAAEWRTPYLAFHERVRTTKVYVRDCTPVPPLAVMIFGGGHVAPSVARRPDDYYGDRGETALCMDDWLTLNVMPASAADVVLEVRKRVDALLAHMVEGQAKHGGERGSWSHADDAEKAALVDTVVSLARLEVLPREAQRKMQAGGGGGGGVSKKGGGKSKGKGKGKGGGSHPHLGVRQGTDRHQYRSARCQW